MTSSRGFAGPGEYTNHDDGSPVAAPAAAQAAVDAAGPQWIASDIHCVFIEEDKDRFENLKARIARIPVKATVRPRVLQESFVEGMAKVRSATPGPFERPFPLFVFIDPFGATGVLFNVVADILRSLPDGYDLGQVLAAGLTITDLTSDLTLQWNVSGGGLALKSGDMIVGVPEPTTAVVPGLGAIGLLSRRRKRSSHGPPSLGIAVT